MSALTALIADWGRAGGEVGDTLLVGTDVRLVEGSVFVFGVNAALPSITSDYTLLSDGSGGFPEQDWFGDATNHLSHAGVSAVTFALPGIESYGDMLPSGVVVKTSWLREHQLNQTLLAFGWERLLTLSCSIVVTSNYELAPINSAARQEALGRAYYDQIRDSEIVENLCEQ